METDKLHPLFERADAAIRESRRLQQEVRNSLERAEAAAAELNRAMRQAQAEEAEALLQRLKRRH